MLERHVEEVARAAGGIEHADAAQLLLERAQSGQRFVGVFLLARRGERERGGSHILPFLAERLDDGGEHEPFDVGARREVRAERVTLARVECAFEQGAEDSGLHELPVGPRRLAQKDDLVARKRQHLGVLEQFAVEAGQRAAERDRELALVHRLPQFLHHRHELRGIGDERLEQVREAAFGDQFHVLSKEREQAAAEETRHAFRLVFRFFKRAGNLRESFGNLARDAGGLARRIQPDGIEPDLPQAIAQAGVAKLVDANPMRPRVWKRRVGSA